MTTHAIIAALRQYDKPLWAANATYKEAAKLIGCKPAQIKKALPDAGLEFYKSPDWCRGPRSPTKQNSIGRKSWGRLKQLFSEKRDLIESYGVTMPFVIRLCRHYRLPANEHIVNELLTLRKITLKGVV